MLAKVPLLSQLPTDHCSSAGPPTSRLNSETTACVCGGEWGTLAVLVTLQSLEGGTAWKQWCPYLVVNKQEEAHPGLDSAGSASQNPAYDLYPALTPNCTPFPLVTALMAALTTLIRGRSQAWDTQVLSDSSVQPLHDRILVPTSGQSSRQDGGLVKLSSAAGSRAVIWMGTGN